MSAPTLNDLLTRTEVFEQYKRILNGTAGPPLCNAPMDRSRFGFGFGFDSVGQEDLIYRWRVEMCLFMKMFIVTDEDGVNHQLVLEVKGSRALFSCNQRVFSGRLPEQTTNYVTCMRCLDG